jgi:hypothetical protein
MIATTPSMKTVRSNAVKSDICPRWICEHLPDGARARDDAGEMMSEMPFPMPRS